MMKKFSAIIVCSLLLLTGCSSQMELGPGSCESYEFGFEFDLGG